MSMVPILGMKCAPCATTARAHEGRKGFDSVKWYSTRYFDIALSVSRCVGLGRSYAHRDGLTCHSVIASPSSGNILLPPRVNDTSLLSGVHGVKGTPTAVR